MINLKQVAKFVMEKCRENGAGGTPEAQVLALAEEVGEFVGAYRRWSGQARRRGTEAEARNELADIIISAYAMADVMGWDVDQLVETKVRKIMYRGWKEAEAQA
jgi:NTP pyrophosphatase (non-canonical NTP hydrolase)